MKKSNYKIKWYDFLVMGLICVILSLSLLFGGFSFLLGDKGYSDLSSSKTSGLVFLVSKIEQTGWKYFLVLVFTSLAYVFFKQSCKIYKRR